MRTLLRCLLVCVAVGEILDYVAGHGRLIEPAARNCMWRYGYKNPKNYNDMGLNCGGFTNQFERNQGRCGVCGDPYQGEREHEAGGRYGRGMVARQYNTGGYMNVTVELTSNHLGYFEFRLCPVNDPRKKATKACMDRHVLNIMGHGKRYFISQRDTSIYVEMFVQLPPNLRCSQCVLQWKWVAGQSMGPDGYGGECLGCGNQEHFVNCADIAIGTAPVQPLPPPAGGFKEPAPAKVTAYSGKAQPVRAGPPYQTAQPSSQNNGPPVFDGSVASILSQVFVMASRANRIKAAQAPKAAAAQAPNLNPPAPKPPTWNPQPQKPPTWKPKQPQPPTWNPTTQQPPAPAWNPSTQPPPAWIPPTQSQPVWNPVTSSPVLNNVGYATSTSGWMNQQGWQQPSNQWVQPSNPVNNPPTVQAAPTFFAQPSGWDQNLAQSGSSSYQSFDKADFAGYEPGEYPEAGEMPSPGEHVPFQANSNPGSSYMQGYKDAVNQLKNKLGLSATGNGYNGKMNTALSELSLTIQEQHKQPSFSGSSSTYCPGGATRECIAGGAFAGNSEFDSWCTSTCTTGQCPANMCSCTCPGGGHANTWNAGGGCQAVDRNQASSMDTWCVANCKQNNCPSDLCTCGFST